MGGKAVRSGMQSRQQSPIWLQFVPDGVDAVGAAGAGDAVGGLAAWYDELSLRRNEIVHVEIEFAQIFMRAFVVRIFLKRLLIEGQRGRIVADHPLGEPQIVQNVRAVRTGRESTFEMGYGICIFLMMDQSQRLCVVVELDAAAETAGWHAAAIAARGGKGRNRGAGRQQNCSEQNRFGHDILPRDLVPQ